MISPSDFDLPAKFVDFRIVDKKAKVSQLDIAFNIHNSPTRFDMLPPPTGAGKSLIYMTLAKLDPSSRVLVLMRTKGLQSQVFDDFESIGLVDIRGRGNYRCKDVTNRYVSCDSGKCTFGYSCELQQDGCTWFDKLRETQASSLVQSNFALIASLSRYSDVGKLGDYDVIVIDEAHSLLPWLSDFCSIKLDRRDVSKLLSKEYVWDTRIKAPKTLDENDAQIPYWSKWANDAIPIAKEALVAAEQLHDSGKYELMWRIKSLTNDLRTTSRIASSSSRWVIEPWRYGVTLTPVSAKEFLNDYVYNDVPKVVLVSANLTPGDMGEFGIDPSECTYHESGIGFDPARRPIYYVPTITPKYQMAPYLRRTWMARIDEIIKPRLQWRGIIHTWSYKRAQEIYRDSKFSDRMILHKGSAGLDAAIEEYLASDGRSILLSPSVMEGHSFDDDTARWQIIPYLPFPNPYDLITIARKAEIPNYMTKFAAKIIQQMAGRIVRNERDWGETFIPDDRFSYVRKSDAFASWFNAAVVWSDNVPSPLGERMTA